MSPVTVTASMPYTPLQTVSLTTGSDCHTALNTGLDLPFSLWLRSRPNRPHYGSCLSVRMPVRLSRTNS